MDKLSESQRASISKMSDERLQSKLSKAGYQPEILIQFTQTDLINAMAEVMIEEEEKEKQAEAAAQIEVEESVETFEVDRTTEITVGIEERRMLLEEKRLQLELEKRKWRAELQMRERFKKEKMEIELRARELDLRKLTAEREIRNRRKAYFYI